MPRTKKEKILDLLPVNPAASAELAELEYVSDALPGYHRKRSGKGFIFVDEKGKKVQNDKFLERISSLVIPPAWRRVWISKSENGHIQVTGRDAKNRKQYIYHSKWEEIRNQTKFYRLIKFAESLPVIRESVNADLRKHSLTKEKVVAIIIRLLEETMIRIGNLEYAANGSYGLTTLKDEHLIVDELKFKLVFNGKSGKAWEVNLLNKRLARLVKQCQDLPGQELFRYVDNDGVSHAVSSTDVNKYLAGIMGENFSAKDFRTWGGTVLAAKELFLLGPAVTEKEEKKKITKAIKNVSAALNNTPSVCRSYYIHPHIIESFLDGTLFEFMRIDNNNGEGIQAALSREEKSVIKILKNKLEI